jgi:transcriptional regulator with XRE-family HTH domain
MTVQHDWIPSVDTFSERLVLVRHRMGWNLKEAALACGISPQSWREWELEHREPRRYQEACARIADRTGCNRVWLMTGIALPSDDGGGTSQPVDLFELAA